MYKILVVYMDIWKLSEQHLFKFPKTTKFEIYIKVVFWHDIGLFVYTCTQRASFIKKMVQIKFPHIKKNLPHLTVKVLSNPYLSCLWKAKTNLDCVLGLDHLSFHFSQEAQMLGTSYNTFFIKLIALFYIFEGNACKLNIKCCAFFFRLFILISSSKKGWIIFNTQILLICWHLNMCFHLNMALFDKCVWC